MSELADRFPQLAPLGAEALGELERRLVRRTSAAGEVFLAEGELPGERAGAMFFLLSGKVEVLRRLRAGGKPKVIRTLEPGEVFGLITLLDDGPRAATCRAATEVVTASLDRARLEQLRSSDALYARLQLVIARQLALDMRNLGAMLGHALLTHDPGELRRRVAGA